MYGQQLPKKPPQVDDDIDSFMQQRTKAPAASPVLDDVDSFMESRTSSSYPMPKKPTPAKMQRRADIIGLQNDLSRTGTKVREGETLDLASGQKFPTQSRFESPVSMDFRGPSEAQKIADRALVASGQQAPAKTPTIRGGALNQRAPQRPVAERLQDREALTQQQRLFTPEQRNETPEQFQDQLAQEKARREAAAKAKAEEEAARAKNSRFGRAAAQVLNPAAALIAPETTSKAASHFVRGVVGGTATTPLRMGAMTDPTAVGRQVFSEAAQNVEDATGQYFPVDRTNPATLNVLKGQFYSPENIAKIATENAPEVIGQMVPQMAISRGAGGLARLAAPALSEAALGTRVLGGLTGAELASRTAAGGLGAATQAQQAYQNAIAKGFSHEQALQAAAMEAPAGALEFAGSAGTTGIVKPRTAIGREMREEGLQELTQNLASDLTSKYGSGYAADKPIGDIIGEAAGSGLLGAAVGGLGALPGAMTQTPEQARISQIPRNRAAIDQRSRLNEAAIQAPQATPAPQEPQATPAVPAQPNPVTPGPQPAAPSPVSDEIDAMEGGKGDLLRMLRDRMIETGQQAGSAQAQSTGQRLIDRTRQKSEELAQSGDFDGAISELQAHQRALRDEKAVQMKEAKGTPGRRVQVEREFNKAIGEAGARIGQIRKEKIAANRQANKPTAEMPKSEQNIPKVAAAPISEEKPQNTSELPISKKLSASENQPAQVPLNQPAESQALSPNFDEIAQDIDSETNPTVDFTSKTPARSRRNDTENLTIGGMLKRRFPEGIRIADRGEARNLGGREGNALVGLVNKNSRVGVDDVAYALHEEGLRLPDGRPFVEDGRVVATEADVLNFLRTSGKEKVGGTKSLRKSLENEEADHYASQEVSLNFDEIAADIDGNIDTDMLAEARAYGRKPQTEQFTEEPPEQRDLGRRITPFRPPSPETPRPVGNRPLSTEFAGERVPQPMRADFPRARRAMVEAGREVEASIAERGEKGEYGNYAEAMFKSQTPDTLHGQDSFFHDQDVKQKLGLPRSAEMGEVRQELKTRMARALGIKASEVSLSQIAPQTWRAFGRQIGLGREAMKKLDYALNQGDRKTYAITQAANASTQESKRAEGQSSDSVADVQGKQKPAKGAVPVRAGKSVDAQIADIQQQESWGLITPEQAKRKIAALRDAPKMREQKAPGFYSQLTRVIEQKMPAKASAAQVRAIIENPQSGIKPDEIKWTGLDDYLRGKDTVTKADVQEFLKANDVRVEETESEKRAYKDYTLPGGKNYRELLLTMPARPFDTSVLSANEQELLRLRKAFRSELSPQDQVRRDKLEDMVGDSVAKKIIQNQPSRYKSSHFDESNILAHIRFNERTDASGKKVLHIEEIQSDWHQEGRRKGYKTPDVVKKQRDLVDLKAKRQEMAAEKARLQSPARSKNNANEIQDLKKRITLLDGQITELVQHLLTEDSLVPDAPFKKTWHELAFKRALRWAAENGFERMTWTTGEQQAERFDLSKRVSRIDFNPQLERLIAYDKDSGIEVIEESGVVADKLEDYIGKEAARKLLDTEADKDGTHTLQGDNLKVGGEGMKGFYDQILPAFANKYARKWGAKTSETTLKTGETVHSVDITPAMRESAMQGQALFQQSAPRQHSADSILDDARIQFKSGKRGQAGTLYANEAAMDVLRDAYEHVFENRVKFDNVNLNTAASKRMATVLQEAANDADFPRPIQRKLREIAREFSHAVQAGQTVSIISTGTEGRKFGDIKTSRRHELFHDAQEGLQSSPDFLAKHKYGKSLIEGLSNYSFEDRTVEAAAFIAGGQAKDFGLSDAQGKEFLKDYFDDIVKNNGREALERFVSLAPKVQDALKEARQQYDVSGTTGKDSTAQERGTGQRTGTSGEPARRSQEVPGQARQQKRFSFGSLENEPRGQVAATGLGGLQNLFGKSGPKTPTKYPLPKDFDLAKWSDKTLRDALAAALPADAKKAYQEATTQKEKLKILGQSQIADDVVKAVKLQLDKMQAAVKAGDGRAALEAMRDIKEFTQAPATNWQKASAIRKAAMLSRPVTHLRNIIGNTAFQPIEELARIPGSIADSAVGLLTGQRAFLGPNLLDMGSATKAAATTGLREAKNMMQGLDVESFEKSAQTPEIKFKNRAVDFAVKAVFRSLNAEDKVFFRYAYDRALSEQAKLTARNEAKQGVISRKDVSAKAKSLKENPTPQMEVAAKTAAEIAVFRNNNKLSTALGNAREGLGDKGSFALDLFLPFDKTPTNIIARTLEYTPVGIGIAAGKGLAATGRAIKGTRTNLKEGAKLKAAIKEAVNKAMTPAQQRSFSQLVGRSVTGSAAPILLGYTLAAAGLATGFYDEEDRKGNAQQKEGGARPSSIKIGGRWYQIGGVAPIGNLIALGATLHGDIGAEADMEDKTLATAKGVMQVATDVPLLRSAKDLVEAIQKPERSGSMVGRMAGSFIPGIVGDISQSIPGVRDQFERNTRAPKEVKGLDKFKQEAIGEVQSKVPYWRKLLPEKKTPLGKPMETEWSDVIDPFSSRPAEDYGGTFQGERLKQGSLPSEVKQKKGEPDAVYKQRVERTQAWMDEYGSRLIASPRYQSLTPDEQKTALEALRRRIGAQQNKTRPQLNSLEPNAVLLGIKKSATTRQRQRGRVLWQQP